MGVVEFTAEDLLSRPLLADVDTIKIAVAGHFHLPTSTLVHGSRQKSVALARHFAMFLARRHSGRSYPELGVDFGRDHTTVMSAVRKIEALVQVDPVASQHLREIEAALAERPEP
jgi:chromosomal replication initiator protein